MDNLTPLIMELERCDVRPQHAVLVNWCDFYERRPENVREVGYTDSEFGQVLLGPPVNNSHDPHRYLRRLVRLVRPHPVLSVGSLKYGRAWDNIAVICATTGRVFYFEFFETH